MSYRFFQNRECEHFPCHEGGKEENFNCLFCFCPLYALGEDCGGRFTYLENGVKDCSACDFPHAPESYDLICARFPKLAELCCKRPGQRDERNVGKA